VSRLPPEGVIPDGPDEHDRRTEAGRRDRLVAALAAMVPRERPAGDRLARPRKPLDGDDQVDVDRSDDDDPTAHAWTTNR